jgi:hypothetical protein
VQTFFSAAFLAALGTTVLILYLMTVPVTLAVQGAYVVAAVCTGAALGGVAVLFSDVSECLGCLLGGFCLSMWLLTLHPGGLVPSASGKVLFIAAFTLSAFGLYFSRWTRTYGLIGCISLSGSTAVVMGVDCFTRAGLKEFWAYIWALNDKLFPDGAVTYPLTRGIRVELAVTIILSVFGIISQLKLWRVIQNRRNKKSKDESSDEELPLPDEEEGIGRQVEEMAARERRQWERVYGDGGSAHGGSDSAVGDMDSEKLGTDGNRTPATSATKDQGPVELEAGEVPNELSEKAREGQKIPQKDDGDGRMTVRVAQDDTEEGAREGHSPEKDGDVEENSLAPAGRRRAQTGLELPIVPLPFKIPAARGEKDGASVAGSEEDDGSSVVAVADEGGDTQAPDAERPAGLPRDPTNLRRSVSQRSIGGVAGGKGVVGWRYGALVEPKKTMDDSDSIIAILDDKSTGVDAYTDADTAEWSPRGGGESVRGGVEAEEQAAGTMQPDASADEVQTQENQATVLGDLRSPMAQSRSLATEKAAVEARGVADDNNAGEVAGDAPLKSGATSHTGPGSATSFRTMVARLTELNLPPALPSIAMTYRTNEWAKHLSIADVPEPEVLQLSEPIPDAADEEPAHLDIVNLQQTAANGAPPPAPPRTSSAMSNHAPLYTHSRSASGISLTASELTGIASTTSTPDLSGYRSGSASTPDLSSGWRPGHYRSTSKMSSTVLAEPIPEEDGEYRSITGVQKSETAQTQPTSAATHGLSSMSTPNLLQSRPQTLIGMRGNLIRSRASGIFTSFNNDALHTGVDPSLSDADTIRNHPHPVTHSSTDLPTDLDDLPLTQRRAMMRRSSLPVPIPTPPTPTAESILFNSHQPARNSTLISDAARQAMLANFRNSVATDLRASTPIITHSPSPRRLSSSTLGGGGGPYSANPSTSMLSLHSTATVTAAADETTTSNNTNNSNNNAKKADLLRNMNLQRSILLGQRELEAHRKGELQLQRERYQREFEERMRSGALMGAHREAMRRLQGGVKVEG